jgi:nucleoside-diphosphate-sugar epimerase
LDASLGLLEAARKAKISRFVFASTCSNYGRMKDSSAYVTEETELAPVSLYAETKVAVEKAVLDPAQTNGLCATAMRVATVFGVSPRMRFDLTVNEFTMEMITKQHLVVFGETQWRPYVHVRDMGRAIVAILAAPADAVRNQVFNVGDTGQNYQKQQLVDLIKPYAPDAKVEYVFKKEDPRDYRVSFDKIGRVLGYSVSRTVPDGVREVSDLVRAGVIDDYSAPLWRN